VPLDSGATLKFGATGPTRVQHLPITGGINTFGTLGQPFSVMSPFMTLNYIIRSGPPAF
jgi:hypothetical protein